MNRSGRGGFRFLSHLFSLMTLGDRLVFFLLLGIGIFSIFTVRLLLPPGRNAAIFVANRLVAEWRLNENAEREIAGRHGLLRLRIENNSICVIDSSCPEKICIRQGRISRRGEIIVCVPNETVVIIDGKEGNAFDAVTP
jgi:hypothetical protein